MPSHGRGGVTSSRPQVENKSPHDRKIARGFFVSGRRGGERTSAFSCTVAAAESVYRHAAVPTAEGRQKTSHCWPHRGRRPTFPRVPTAPPCAPLAGIAPERTARTHNPVTRHKNRNGVASHGACHGAHAYRRARPSVAHAERQVTIRQGRGKRHIEQLAPHGQLKWRAVQIEIRQGRQRQKPREVSAQPPQRCLDKGRLIRNLRARQVPFQSNALRPGFRLVRHGAMAFALEP